MKKTFKMPSVKKGISLRTAVMFLAIILLAVIGITKFNDVMEQRSRLTAENIALKREKQALKEELDRINKEANNTDSKAYVESIARTHLDMVYPDEIIFHISED
ncbi:MAG: cell division protein FtsL [Clostridia bacterium]|nr:cell division protein FtsL [Clostridia bacterium]